jgi:hypothetical protein
MNMVSGLACRFNNVSDNLGFWGGWPQGGWHQVPCPPKEEERVWWQKGLLSQLFSHSAGKLCQKTTLFISLTQMSHIYMLRPLTGKREGGMAAWTLPVARHLSAALRKRKLALGRQPMMPATLTSVFSLGCTLPPFYLCQKVFPGCHPIV